MSDSVYICSGKFDQNHVGDESDNNSVFFFPTEMPLVSDHITPPVRRLIQYSTEKQINWAIA